MTKNTLLEGFQGISAKAWKQKIQFDLRGADYNDTLLWESPEGIVVKPFYSAEDLEGKVCEYSKTDGNWLIGQHIYTGEPQKANKKALDALERGAESLWFEIPSPEPDLSVLLSGLEKSASFYFDFEQLSLDACKSLIGALASDQPRLSLLLDPIGHLARKGVWFYDQRKDFEILRALLSDSKDRLTTSVISVDTALYQNAGATIVQQLAYALAHANEYLNSLFSQGHQPNFTFKVAVGSNYFFEISKIRALRLLWRTLSQAYGYNLDCNILAVPSKRNKTLYDYNTNMLRTTTECMSAVLGGADTICNLPYDSLYHKDNEFGERLSRNQLLILKNESYFDKVSNPADGTYYIENLTDQMAKKALDLFKDIEKGGGFIHQLKEHIIQKKIKESALKEQQLFDTGTEILVGSNKYQNPSDRMKEHLELYPFLKTASRKTTIEPILEKRLAEGHEQERLKHE